MTRITVGLPFFDEARTLGSAIRSVLAQSVSDFELMLIDDGSRDDSLAIARSFSDPRITLIADGERRYLPARLNEIVRRARTPLVARFDADDMMHPSRLALQLAVLDADASCDAVGTWAILVDAETHPFAVVESGPLPATRRSALLQGVVPHATLLGRRAWFLANPYDETLTRAEDRDLWCRTFASRIEVVAEPLYVIRVDVTKRSFLSSYVEAQRQNRVVAKKYGPAFVGRLETTRLVAAASMKSCLMRALFTAGLSQRLVLRRGRPPTAHECTLAREAIAACAQRP